MIRRHREITFWFNIVLKALLSTFALSFLVVLDGKHCR
jgi:hypothetical protein